MGFEIVAHQLDLAATGGIETAEQVQQCALA
jgi:hypothetical protein